MNSIEKSIQILNYLSHIERSVGITELSLELSFPKSTVHRILNTLLKHSLVNQDKETLKYKLGLQIIEYSNSFYNSFDFRQVAKPILKDICRDTNLTTHLTTWYNEKGICIDSIIASQRTNTNLFVEIGKEMPFNCSASAKVLLAYQPPMEIKRIIYEKEFHKYTPKTIIDPNKLENHLIELKRKGFAICDEEMEVGIKAISAPVRNINNKVISSITITGMSKQLDQKNAEKFTSILVNSARELSRVLGYRNKNRFN